VGTLELCTIPGDRLAPSGAITISDGGARSATGVIDRPLRRTRAEGDRAHQGQGGPFLFSAAGLPFLRRRDLPAAGAVCEDCLPRPRPKQASSLLRLPLPLSSVRPATSGMTSWIIVLTLGEHGPAGLIPPYHVVPLPQQRPDSRARKLATTCSWYLLGSRGCGHLTWLLRAGGRVRMSCLAWVSETGTPPNFLRQR